LEGVKHLHDWSININWGHVRTLSS
jgi:hypothetical protein